MIETHKLAMFLTASLVLAATPGPGMLYVLTRTLAGGRREGILSSLGTFVGGMVHVVAAAAGLSVVLATSALAFSVVKLAGAAYLIFLGLRMVLSAERESSAEVTAKPPRHSPGSGSNFSPAEHHGGHLRGIAGLTFKKPVPTVKTRSGQSTASQRGCDGCVGSVRGRL
jgi:threonine/homoserine/homoserine lactone efflux protein